MSHPPPRQLLRQMFDAAVAAAQPACVLPAFLPPLPELFGTRHPEDAGRLVLIGAGKASAAMAQVVEQHYLDEARRTGWPLSMQGLVVTRYGHALPCQRVQVLEAAHPVPDAAGEAAARALLRDVQGLTPNDRVICLMSGGGSALLPAALPGLSLADKQTLHRALLASGASIAEMNTVRRHLSAIKGGRLAAACAPAPVLNLLISDVPGDDPADIASGPTVPDASTCADALALLARYRIALPPAALALLNSPLAESLKAGDPRLPAITTRLVAAPQASLQAAAAVARQAGAQALVLGDAIEGEAREVAKVLAAIALQCARPADSRSPANGWQRVFEQPLVLLSGGETTVTLPPPGAPGAPAPGRGGRNVEFLLSLGLTLRGAPGIYALAADTDGIDGVDRHAGAWLTPDTLERAWATGLNPPQVLDRHDAHALFEALGDSLSTGPTLTNVNDFRAIWLP